MASRQRKEQDAIAGGSYVRQYNNSAVW